jgi:hypothetical protein
MNFCGILSRSLLDHFGANNAASLQRLSLSSNSEGGWDIKVKI